MKTKTVILFVSLCMILFFSCNEEKENISQDNIFLNPELVDKIPESLKNGNDLSAELNKILPAVGL